MLKINKNGKVEIYNIRPIYQNGDIAYFSTAISIREIGEIYEYLTYDSEAQRGSELIKGKYIPMIDQKHVNKIKSQVINRGSVRGHLTWNIRKQNDSLEGEDYTYIAEKNCLIINENMITLPDSAHRHTALYQLCEENADDIELLENEFCLDIHNMDLESEKVFFTDINSKGKAVPRNRTLFLSNDIKSKLLREVIAESLLKDRVECEKERTTTGDITKFATLYDSLFGTSGSYRKIKITENNFIKIKKWFIKFYNELIKIREEFNFKTPEKKKAMKNTSMILEEIMWWGYSYMLKELDGNTHWKSILHNKMSKKLNIIGMTPVDFWSKTNPSWDCVRVYNLNRETGKIELGTSCYNSNTTRQRIQSIVSLNLFS